MPARAASRYETLRLLGEGATGSVHLATDTIRGRRVALKRLRLPGGTDLRREFLTLAGLRIFEQLSPPRNPADPSFQHALIEAYCAVAAERGDTTTDPDSAPMTTDELLSPARLSRIARGTRAQ